MEFSPRHAVLLLAPVLACAVDSPDDPPSAATGAEMGEDGGETGGTEGGGDGDQLFDVEPGAEGGGDEGSATDGCQKIDFLFVIDNSGSMADEQAQLVASFPGFMSTIEDTLMVSDYQILVADTDPASVSSKSYCGGAGCCDSFCAGAPEGWCCELMGGECDGGALCTPPDDACDVELGAGLDDDQDGGACDFTGGQRYIVDGEPDLDAAFECAALVGTDGEPAELVIESMLAATGPQADPGACNGGFLRDDAILVVTLITDEGDSSEGLPGEWHDALVATKGGDEEAIVVLALVGDTDLNGTICEEFDEGVGSFGDGAKPAPRFRDFASSFPYGSWGSVCEADYEPFFANAVSDIDTACDEFVPPG